MLDKQRERSARPEELLPLVEVVWGKGSNSIAEIFNGQIEVHRHTKRHAEERVVRCLGPWRSHAKVHEAARLILNRGDERASLIADMLDELVAGVLNKPIQVRELILALGKDLLQTVVQFRRSIPHQRHELVADVLEESVACILNKPIQVRELILTLDEELFQTTA